MKAAPVFSCVIAKHPLDEGKNYDSFDASEIAVWLLTSNLIAPNKVGAAAPILLNDLCPWRGKAGCDRLGCSSLSEEITIVVGNVDDQQKLKRFDLTIAQRCCRALGGPSGNGG